MARLSLALLGSFQATLDGRSVTEFASDKVRALLAYLAVEADRPHRRETLAGLLWPDRPDVSALTNLRNALANVRKAIRDRETAAPVILADRETIQFNPAGEAWVDVQAFRALTESHQPVDSLERGTALYRGPLLEGFCLKDSAPFEEWVQIIREQLQRQCLASLARLAEHHEQRGDLDKAREVAWKQVELAPWQEETHRYLMRLLAQSGQRGAALAQYGTCRYILQTELGVEPAPETVTLYGRIRAGEFAPESTGAPAIPSGPPHPNLPTWNTPLVGRQALLAEIRDRLGDPACRLLTLVGPGGCGKTRLAAQAAGQATAFPDGVYLVPLASLQSSDAIVPAIALALGFAFQRQPSPREQLLDYLRQKTMLIILDNFEHLLEGVAFVIELLQAAPQVKVMVTSRVTLNLQEEQLLPVPGLDYPAACASWDEALQHSGIQLFVQGARRVHPAFEPSGQDQAHLIEICRLVEGMPLSLLLAAAWMRLLTLAEIAAQITQHSLDFLESDGPDMPARQRSLRAVFDHSWRLLTEREQQILAGLAVFRGGLTYMAAQQVTGATLRDLIKLVNSSLLDRTATGRYTLHELLRQYAEEKLNGLLDGGQGVRDRHAGYYATALQRWTAEIKGPRQQDALAEMDAELDNVLVAWNWAIERGQVMRLAEGMEGLDWYCVWRMRHQVAGQAFQKAAEALATDDASQPPERLRAWARTLYVQGHLGVVLDQHESVREQVRQSLELLDIVEQTGQDVRRDRAFALLRAGIIQTASGEVKDAQTTLAASLSLLRELDEPWATAILLARPGMLAEQRGDYAEAVRCYRESLSIRRALGVHREMIESQQELSRALANTGQLEEAERLARECVALCRTERDQADLARGLFILAEILCISGRYAECPALLDESAAIYDRLGYRVRVGHVLNRLGEVEAGLGRYDRARAHWQKSLALFQELSFKWGIGLVTSNLGGLALAEGHWAKAGELCQAGVVTLREIKSSQLRRAISGLASAALRLGDLGLARASLAEVLRDSVKLRAFITALYVLPHAALFVAETANVERGVELYALASRYPFIANSVLWRDMVGKHIAARAKALPPEIVAAAEQRGRDRELWATLEELRAEFE